MRQGPPPRAGHGGRPRRYDAVGIGAWREVAAASDWRCGKRLAPFLSELVPALEAEGALHRAEPVRERLLGMSAARRDRPLRTARLQRRPSGLSTTTPGSLLKPQGPVHTCTPGDEQQPGCVEIARVAHGGTSTAGFYLNSLTVTDVATGWTACGGVWGKRPGAVFTALAQARARWPMPRVGIDADTGAASLNARLVRWCTQEPRTFTRRRPYWNNAPAHVEQKTWSIVRRLLGYDRYESEAALAAVQAVYAVLQRWILHGPPGLQRIRKERAGARGRKRYATARTPYQRVLAWGGLSAAAAAQLQAEHPSAGPRALWQQGAATRAARWRLDGRTEHRETGGEGDSRSGPPRLSPSPQARRRRPGPAPGNAACCGNATPSGTRSFQATRSEP